MILKKELARTIVRELHGEKLAGDAQKTFEATFQNQEPSKEMITIFNTTKNTVDIIDVLVESGLCISKSEARRLIAQKGIDEESIRIDNTMVTVDNDKIYKIGKKRFLKIQKRS